MTNSVVSDVPSTSNYQNKNNLFSLLSQMPCLHLPHQKKRMSYGTEGMNNVQ